MTSRSTAGAWAGALALTLFLNISVPGELFLSGDAALKAAMMRQFAAGQLHPDLRLPRPDWAQSLWNAGLYPFTPPYIQRLHGEVFIQWSLGFPALTAPFYKAGGFRGALLVPLLATWATWWAFMRVLAALGIAAAARAAALTLFAFATFLSLYAAMYWEFNAAVALVFCGGALLLAPPQLRPGRAFSPACWPAAACGFARRRACSLAHSDWPFSCARDTNNGRGRTNGACSR